jgi:hypothetical protein
LSSRPQRSEVEEPASPLAISQQSGCPIFSAAGGEVGNREAVRSLDSPTLQKSIHGWLNILGPVTANSLAAFLSIEPAEIYKAFLAMEMQGNLIRGVFEGSGNLGAPHLASEMWVPTSEHSASRSSR